MYEGVSTGYCTLFQFQGSSIGQLCMSIVHCPGIKYELTVYVHGSSMSRVKVWTDCVRPGFKYELIVYVQGSRMS